MNAGTQNLLYFTSIEYALDVGAMYIILGTLASLALGLEKKRVVLNKHTKLYTMNLRSFEQETLAEYSVGLLFLVSAIPVFWTPTPIGHLRFVLWYFVFMIPIITHLHSGSTNGKKDR
jgi:hypothetical protein